MNENTRIIFLDVDGVLNSVPQMKRDKIRVLRTRENIINIQLSDVYLRNLSRIYRRYPDTKIVLTSSYKKILNSPRGDYLQMKLSEYGMKIFGFSPDVFHDTGEYCTTRPQEIAEWLNMHPEIEHWVSIEDDNDEDKYKEAGKHLWYHLCKTECGSEKDKVEDCGLNWIKTHVALEILGKEYE